MKIAFIVSEFPALSQTFILNQITGLLDLGHEVEIFAQSNPKDKKVHSDVKKYHLIERTHYSGIPRNKIKRILKAIYLIITNFYKGPIKILKSLNIIKYGKKSLSLELLYILIPFLNKRFDVIQCHFGTNGNIGAYLKEIGFKSKLITTFHGSDTRLGIEKGGNIYHRLFKFGDCFLAITDYNYKNLIRFGANSQKIIFHPVGIEIDKFPLKQKLTVKRSIPIVILTVARLVEEKGLQYGIDAISKLLERNHDLCLEYRIIGGGTLEKELKMIVKKLKLDSIVHFIGPMSREEIVQEMFKANIFLLPSVAESFGVVLLEAQSVGLPIVATNVGGVSQAIIDCKSGFLVTERDADALAEKLEYLIEHPELWPKMGRCGRKYVEEKYDIKKLNQKLVEIYQNLITY